MKFGSVFFIENAGFKNPKILQMKHLKSGPGIPNVFLHGFLGTADDWNPVCSYLPYECIGFDLPGHGNTPFVEEWVIDIPRFNLIGYSLGGRLAMAYAAQHPEQIASLTILSAHPGLTSEEEKKKRLESDQKWAQLLLSLPIEEFLALWYEQPLFKPFKPDLTQRKKQNRTDLAAALVHYSLAKQPRYEIETAIVGERDEKFRALYKNPIVIPNAGHMLHLENPKAVAEAIISKNRTD